jgi:hypothetical protein
MAPETGQTAQTKASVRHLQLRDLTTLRSGNHYRRRALLHHLPNESMAIEIGAAEGHEKLTRLNTAGVGADGMKAYVLAMMNGGQFPGYFGEM